MICKRVLIFAALALLALPLASAEAGWRVGVRIGFPMFINPYPYRPVYVAPAPVYVAGPPVYYYPPAPVYVQPAPVYAQPAPTYAQPAPAAAPANQYLPPQPVPVQAQPGR
jgi:hypothetical protein